MAATIMLHQDHTDASIIDEMPNNMTIEPLFVPQISSNVQQQDNFPLILIIAIFKCQTVMLISALTM